MGPWIGLLLFVVILAPRCSKCGHEGRELKVNEFPELAYINREGDFIRVDNNTRLCMGVIHGSITVITSAGCAWQILNNKVNGTTLRTSKNFFHEEEETITYPTVNIRLSDPSTKPGFNFSFAILNLQLPGIQMEPYYGKGDVTGTQATGIRAAIWLSDPIDVTYLITKTVTGVVVTPDKRVVAMTLLSEKQCIDKFSLRTTFDPQPETLSKNAMCAIKARYSTSHGQQFVDVEPGYVCADDYGAPFIYEGKVIGILVRGFCEFVGPNEPELGVFLTLLPSDDIDKAVTEHANPSTLSSKGKISHVPDNDGGRSDEHTTDARNPTNPTSNDKPTEKSGGLAIHSNHYALVISILITKLSFH